MSTDTKNREEAEARTCDVLHDKSPLSNQLIHEMVKLYIIINLFKDSRFVRISLTYFLFGRRISTNLKRVKLSSVQLFQRLFKYLLSIKTFSAITQFD